MMQLSNSGPTAPWDGAAQAPWSVAKAFPVLAIVPGLRRMGLVALGAGMQVRCARLRCLRAGKDPALRAERALACVRHALRAIAPATVVIEHGRPGPKPRSVPGFEERMAEAVREAGATLLRRPLAEACETLVPGGRSELLAQLAERHPELGSRLGSLCPQPRRDTGRWREVRPLFAAFALATCEAEAALRQRPPAHVAMPALMGRSFVRAALQPFAPPSTTRTFTV